MGHALSAARAWRPTCSWLTACLTTPSWTLSMPRGSAMTRCSADRPKAGCVGQSAECAFFLLRQLDNWRALIHKSLSRYFRSLWPSATNAVLLWSPNRPSERGRSMQCSARTKTHVSPGVGWVLGLSLTGSGRTESHLCRSDLSSRAVQVSFVSVSHFARTCSPAADGTLRWFDVSTGRANLTKTYVVGVPIAQLIPL